MHQANSHYMEGARYDGGPDTPVVIPFEGNMEVPLVCGCNLLGGSRGWLDFCNYFTRQLSGVRKSLRRHTKHFETIAVRHDEYPQRGATGFHHESHITQQTQYGESNAHGRFGYQSKNRQGS